MGEDRYGNISTSYKTVIIEYRGTTARGVTSRVLFHLHIKDPLPNNHPYTTTTTQLAKGGGRLSKRDVSCYSTMLYHVPSIFTLPFFRRGAWVTETPASKFLSCSGTCSHGRGPSCIKLTMSVISVSSSFIDFIV